MQVLSVPETGTQAQAVVFVRQKSTPVHLPFLLMRLIQKQWLLPADDLQIRQESMKLPLRMSPDHQTSLLVGHLNLPPSRFVLAVITGCQHLRYPTGVRSDTVVFYCDAGPGLE